MIIQMTDHQLGMLLRDAAEMGANLALSSIGKLKPYLTKSDAFRAYGRKNIERWIDQGLITPRKDGNQSAPWRIERIEVEAIRKALDTILYI